jgi:hypothetical protein
VAEPLSETVLQAVVGMLQQITVANGYFTDLGTGRITTEPTQQSESNEPYIALTETEITVTQLGQRTVSSDMLITIEAIVPCAGASRKPANTARRAREDILRALRSPLRARLPGLRSIAPEKTQRIVFDDERFSNSVICQVTARAGLSESIQPAATP